MTENMKVFVDAVSNDDELKRKFNEIDKGEQENPKVQMAEYIALAKEAEITLTEEDFQQDDNTEMNDDELQAVVGGTFVSAVWEGVATLVDKLN